jgi:hypothetical protein
MMLTGTGKVVRQQSTLYLGNGASRGEDAPVEASVKTTPESHNEVLYEP